MQAHRRTLLKGLGGAIALPALESQAVGADAKPAPLRFLIVGNPFGMHPDHFFPKTFGKEYDMPRTLRALGWVRDRLTIVSHTDHGMVSGHGREISFLSGVLPEDAAAFPEKNLSIDQVIARQLSTDVRFPSVNAALQSGIRMNWDANGVELEPITDPKALFDHLFQNLTEAERTMRREVIGRNQSLLDAVRGQLHQVERSASSKDRHRLEQFATSIRSLETRLSDRLAWVGRDKPRFDLSPYYSGVSPTVENHYAAIFDMIAYAFETDLTRVATIAFPSEIAYRELDGVNRSYHGCTHNGKKEDVTDELVAIESFQIAMLGRLMRKLDEVQEPNASGSMLDHTVILFGSGMGYGGTHSNRNLPILVAGGGFEHRGHVDGRGHAGQNMPLCNLFVTLMNRFGIERDDFNT
ncbi:MAG: DUF1552 domain-containing protein, partial [Planctomycetota bacterium]